MSNKVCGKCHTFDSMHNYCIISGDRYANSPACNCFADKCQEITSPTLFDRITQSPEVLAKKLVYVFSPGLFTSNVVDTVYLHVDEAIAATVSKLKEGVDV